MITTDPKHLALGLSHVECDSYASARRASGPDPDSSFLCVPAKRLQGKPRHRKERLTAGYWYSTHSDLQSPRIEEGPGRLSCPTTFLPRRHFGTVRLELREEREAALSPRQAVP